MTALTIELPEKEYERLQDFASINGKSVKAIIEEWVAQLPNNIETLNVKNDPLFTIEGFDSAAPEDYSLQIDQYLYQGK